MVSRLTDIAGPILLRCDEFHHDLDPAYSPELPRHAEEDQVELDVNRSFVYYPKNGEFLISHTDKTNVC